MFFTVADATAEQSRLALEGIETEVVITCSNGAYPCACALRLSRATRLAHRRSHALLRRFYLAHFAYSKRINTDRGVMRNYLTDHRMISSMMRSNDATVTAWVEANFSVEHATYLQRQIDLAWSNADIDRYLATKAAAKS
jgi:hypothetical protein